MNLAKPDVDRDLLFYGVGLGFGENGGRRRAFGRGALIRWLGREKI
jgi:hypothetical protein